MSGSRIYPNLAKGILENGSGELYVKVLHLVDSLSIGGSESLAANLAKGFADRGINNIVCALGENGNLVDRLEKNNIPHAYLGAKSGVRPTAMLRIGAMLLGKHCDAIITHHFRQLLHAAPTAQILGRKIVHVEHDYHSYLERPDIIKKMRYCMPAIKQFIGVSEEITSWFQNRIIRSSNKFLTIKNGVTVDHFRPNERARKNFRLALNIPDDAVVIGTCARMEPVKDLKLLIHGFKVMVRKLQMVEPSLSTNTHLLLVGDGTERQSLEVLAEAMGIGDRCHFVGMVDNVSEWLAILDMYTITSKDEGLPLSVMEAMSVGLPIVACNVGSVSLLVNTTVGYLLEGRDKEELGQVLSIFAQDTNRRKKCGTEARRNICASYSFEATIDGYIKALIKKNNQTFS